MPLDGESRAVLPSRRMKGKLRRLVEPLDRVLLAEAEARLASRPVLTRPKRRVDDADLSAGARVTAGERYRGELAPDPVDWGVSFHAGLPLGGRK